MNLPYVHEFDKLWHAMFIASNILILMVRYQRMHSICTIFDPNKPTTLKPNMLKILIYNILEKCQRIRKGADLPWI